MAMHIISITLPILKLKAELENSPFLLENELINR